MAYDNALTNEEEERPKGEEYKDKFVDSRFEGR